MTHDSPLAPSSGSSLAQRIQLASRMLRDARAEAGKIILDQDYMIEMMLATMLAEGNMLAEGVPGLAKTLTVKTIAQICGLDFKRIQFTADLQPIDLTGSQVHNKQEDTWSFSEGPLFGQLILADEINRAGPKTQSAMLEAMAERQITVDKVTRKLPRPFHVMATQNPVDSDGTSFLPEAQMDRFATKLVFKYPGEDAEKRIMVETSGSAPLNNRTVMQIFNAQDLMAMQDLVREMPLPESVVNTTIAIVRRLRPENGDHYIKENVTFGPSPRALTAFAGVAKARALMDGRESPSKDDILNLLEPVLQHRVSINYASKEKFTDIMAHVRKELRL